MHVYPRDDCMRKEWPDGLNPNLEKRSMASEPAIFRVEMHKISLKHGNFNAVHVLGLSFRVYAN